MVITFLALWVTGKRFTFMVVHITGFTLQTVTVLTAFMCQAFMVFTVLTVGGVTLKTFTTAIGTDFTLATV